MAEVGIPAWAFSAALASAFLHAVWNVMLKAADDTVLESACISACWIVFALILLPFFGLPASDSWGFLAASSLVHVAYFWLLSIAYNRFDLNQVFPIQRGLPPLLVALAAWVFVGETLGAFSWLGIVLICAGVVLTSKAPGGGFDRAALGFGLASAVVIAAYSTLDGLGARSAGGPIVYLLWLALLQSVLHLITVQMRRGAALVRHLRTFWRRSLLLGTMALIGYGLALYAMANAPLGPMTAVRESSVVFAAILGAVFLNENLAGRRIAAAVIIVIGLAAIRLSG